MIKENGNKEAKSKKAPKHSLRNLPLASNRQRFLLNNSARLQHLKPILAISLKDNIPIRLLDLPNYKNIIISVKKVASSCEFGQLHEMSDLVGE